MGDEIIRNAGVDDSYEAVLNACHQNGLRRRQLSGVRVDVDTCRREESAIYDVAHTPRKNRPYRCADVPGAALTAGGGTEQVQEMITRRRLRSGTRNPCLVGFDTTVYSRCLVSTFFWFWQ